MLKKFSIKEMKHWIIEYKINFNTSKIYITTRENQFRKWINTKFSQNDPRGTRFILSIRLFKYNTYINR